MQVACRHSAPCPPALCPRDRPCPAHACRYVVIKDAFSKALASEVVERGWEEMEGKGILRGDPATWSQRPYFRTGGDPQFHVMASRGDAAAKAMLPDIPTRLLSEHAPRALGAQLDMARHGVALNVAPVRFTAT